MHVGTLILYISLSYTVYFLNSYLPVTVNNWIKILKSKQSVNSSDKMSHAVFRCCVQSSAERFSYSTETTTVTYHARSSELSWGHSVRTPPRTSSKIWLTKSTSTVCSTRHRFKRLDSMIRMHKHSQRCKTMENIFETFSIVCFILRVTTCKHFQKMFSPKHLQSILEIPALDCI